MNHKRLISLNKFRVGHSEEKELLRQFFKRSWYETYQNQVGKKTTSLMIEALDDGSLGGILPANEERVILGMNADNIIASCIYATRHDITYVWGCYVLQSVQRSGIGRKMIELILSSGNAGKVLQITVLRSSENAVRFYEKLGFILTGDVKFELVPGHEASALIMKLKTEKYIGKPEGYI